MSSHSPQAAAIAAAIDAQRRARPGQRFFGVADVLSVPELSTASPWLDQSTSTQMRQGISDEAYEIIPTQLLLRLRPDSVATPVPGDGEARIRFTGSDDYSYAIEVSSNLVDWRAIATNSPTHGVIEFAEPFPPAAPQRFYRSSVLP